MPEQSLTRKITSIVQLESDFQRLGLRSGDTVMVHASLRRIGSTENRGHGVITALMNVLGSNGTLMAYADFEPTPEVPYFDIRRSPARPDYGVFAELVRTWPNASRSENPGASMVAIGARAKWLCEKHPVRYGYGPDGPLGKFVSASGKVLLLGSNPDQVTILHHAEHLAQIPNKRVIHRTDNVLRADGTVGATTIEEFDTSNPVVAEMPDRIFATITDNFIATGAAQCGRVGAAEAFLLPAREFVEFAVDLIEKEFGHNKP